MFWEKFLLGLGGLAAGAVTAAGVFAFITAIGLVQRLAAKTGTAHRISWYEDCFVLGGTWGNLISLYPAPLPGGTALCAVLGLSYGVFVGCLIMSLAETLDAFPVLCRRLRLSRGMGLLVLSLALGKCLGSAAYFFWGIGGGGPA